MLAVAVVAVGSDSYRKAARYPWLPVRLVEPSSDFPEVPE
jgi:hypothetical protein